MCIVLLLVQDIPRGVAQDDQLYSPNKVMKINFCFKVGHLAPLISGYLERRGKIKNDIINVYLYTHKHTHYI